MSDNNSLHVLAEQLTKREQSLTELENKLAVEQKDLQTTKQQLDQIRQDLIAKLEKASSLTRQEAQDLLLTELEKTLADEVAKRIRTAEEEYKKTSQDKAQEIILDTMVHGATDYLAEYTVSSVRLPSDEIKGRIIGREGKNIRTFEYATGVEIDMDETNTIRLSSFDPVRREIARRALIQLINDARIQPDRIEEIVEKIKQDVERIILEAGEELCHTCKIYNLPLDLVKILGRYKFRFSYGQSMINHTIEETKIGVSIAGELGADVQMVRLACLLHDIGKVVTEDEGSHVQLGVDLLRKYDLPEIVINAVAEHHEDKPFSSPVSRIVWVADALSGGRPGARYEPHEGYLKRMTKIEEIASSFPGVIEAIAYQAGRDVRVLVKPSLVSDSELTILVSKIAQKLQKEADYVGQIKVTGIRDVRAVAVAA